MDNVSVKMDLNLRDRFVLILMNAELKAIFAESILCVKIYLDHFDAIVKMVLLVHHPVLLVKLHVTMLNVAVMHIVNQTIQKLIVFARMAGPIIQVILLLGVLTLMNAIKYMDPRADVAPMQFVLIAQGDFHVNVQLDSMEILPFSVLTWMNALLKTDVDLVLFVKILLVTMNVIVLKDQYQIQIPLYGVLLW